MATARWRAELYLAEITPIALGYADRGTRQSDSATGQPPAEQEGRTGAALQPQSCNPDISSRPAMTGGPPAAHADHQRWPGQPALGRSCRGMAGPASQVISTLLLAGGRLRVSLFSPPQQTGKSERLRFGLQDRTADFRRGQLCRIAIGSSSDAITHSLLLRQQANSSFSNKLSAALTGLGTTPERYHTSRPFEEGVCTA